MKKLTLGLIILFLVIFICGCASENKETVKDIKIAQLQQEVSELESKAAMQQEEILSMRGEIQAFDEEIEFWGWGVQRFANKLDRTSPEKVAAIYAQTLMNSGDYPKNGALQYGLLSENCKKEMLDTYRSLGWGSRGSSPWVQDYKITKKSEIDGKSVIITLSMTWKTSADNGIPGDTILHMTQNNDGNWEITKIL